MCQKVERVGLEPFFDRSGTESSDLDPAVEPVRPANFSRAPAARIGPALSNHIRLSSPHLVVRYACGASMRAATGEAPVELLAWRR
jgi:hypothetical protein